MEYVKNDREKDKKRMPTEAAWVGTELGSARVVDATGGTKEAATESAQKGTGAFGAPWGTEESMEYVCEEMGVDYDTFVEGVKNNRADEEMASELGVGEAAVKALKERFFEMEATNGNTGLGG